jgi:hypothetical protein
LIAMPAALMVERLMPSPHVIDGGLPTGGGGGGGGVGDVGVLLQAAPTSTVAPTMTLAQNFNNCMDFKPTILAQPAANS